VAEKIIDKTSWLFQKLKWFGLKNFWGARFFSFLIFLYF
jgi:hypothetical protein